MASQTDTILIIRYSSMGDVILTAPCIAFLRERFPDSRIVLITSHVYSDIFKDDKRLSQVVGVRKKEVSLDPAIISVQWDLIVDLQNNNQSAAQITRLRYSTLRRFDKLHFKRNMLLFLRINRYRTGESVALRYIRTCGEGLPVGPLDFSLTFNTGKHDPLPRKAQLGDIGRPVVAFFPFSAWKNKEWSERSFISVGHFFSIKGWNIVVMGGKAEQVKAAKMQYCIGERCISLAGELSLYECGSILKHCNLALGGDTGLSHLARACGVKTGFLYGPTTVHFGFQPDGDKRCTVFESNHFCRPCHPHGGNLCWRFDRRCMQSITPETVIGGLMQMYYDKENAEGA
jgi:heptosyltransferase-2